jgi:hypothetical protein
VNVALMGTSGVVDGGYHGRHACTKNIKPILWVLRQSCRENIVEIEEDVGGWWY